MGVWGTDFRTTMHGTSGGAALTMGRTYEGKKRRAGFVVHVKQRIPADEGNARVKLRSQGNRGELPDRGGVGCAWSNFSRMEMIRND